MKTVRPTYLDPGITDSPDHTVRYLWPLTSEADDQSAIVALADLAGQLAAVGWGLDLVAAHGAVISDEDARQLSGECWLPGLHGEPRTPIATPATLQHLETRHSRFLQRLQAGTLHPVPPVPAEAIQTVCYRRDFEPASSTVAAFVFLKPDATRMQDFSLRQGRDVAGMLRHAVSRAAQQAGWSAERVASFCLGHGESRTAPKHIPAGPARFAFVPLPSLEPRTRGGRADHVGLIRRALIHVPAGGHEEDIAWLLRALAGNDLISEQTGEQMALISPLPVSDNIVQRYLGRSRTSGDRTQTASRLATWSTVTPVILPGFDDQRRTKTESLLRKAIIQAGFGETLAQHAELDWRSTGFLPGADRVDRYQTPDHLQNYPRYHVKVTWQDSRGAPVELTGPIVIGGGRYSGLGLFAADSA